MTARWLVVLAAAATFWAGCVEETSKTTGPSTEEVPTSSPPPGDGGGEPKEPPPKSDPEPPKSNPKPAPPPAPPPPPPPPAACGGSCAYPGPFRQRFQVTIPQFRGARGFVQFDMAGFYVDGRAERHGFVFISDAAGFSGDNWIYVRALDTIPGRPVGGWKIKAEARGAAVESGYTGTQAFRRERTYRVRVEWGGRRVRALLDGQEYTTLNLPNDVVINGLWLWLNETPRAGPDPPYAGATISNVIIGQ